MASKWGAQVEFKNMFTRYPRSVLRHQLGHATSVAMFKARVAPKRGNDAGVGPPGATAHQAVVFQVQVGWCWPRQEVDRALLEVFHSTRNQGEVVCGSLRCGEGVPDPSGEHIRRGQGQSVLVGKFHQLGQVRQGGRFTCVSRCNLSRVEGGCDDGVEKAKAEYGRQVCQISCGVSSVQKLGNRTSMADPARIPCTVGHLTLAFGIVFCAIYSMGI